MSFSIFLNVFSLIWSMISGWISLLGDFGIDGITSLFSGLQ